MKEYLKVLCSSFGVSGEENDICKIVFDLMKRHTDNTVITPNNNVIAIMGNTQAKKHILFDAHLDQIGLIVTYIDEKGFLKVSECGGIDKRVLLGSAVCVLGKEKVMGAICCMPPHLTNGNEDKVVSSDNMWVDTGLPKEKVKELISLGDRVIFYTEFRELLNNKVTSSALDNRAGVAALIKSAEILSKQDLKDVKVTYLFSSQEETNESGAKTGAYISEPDEAIIVDVSFGSQPSVPKDKSGDLGKGVMVCKSPTLSKSVINKIVEILKQNNKQYQFEVSGGTTGTNADAISISKGGVKCGVVSIPLRNMHTQVEVIDISDVEDTAELLAKFVMVGGAE